MNLLEWLSRYARTLGLYLVVAFGSLLLAAPPAYVAPIYPAAGVALALCLRWGWPACAATASASFLLNLWIAGQRGEPLQEAALLTAVISLGAAAQAGLGGWLVRRAVAQPLALEEPRDIVRFFVIGGPLACLISASVATTTLVQAGVLAPERWAHAWLLWWGGDALGTVIAAPLVLAWFGEPREAWRPRRWTVALPILAVSALLVFATWRIAVGEHQSVTARFEGDAGELAQRAQLKVRNYLGALVGLHGVMEATEQIDAPTFGRAALVWLQRQPAVEALGWAERVPRGELAAYEAAVQATGLPDFKVFDREDGRAQIESARDPDALVIRHIRPEGFNDAALGVNVLSSPAAREAVLSALERDVPALSRPFPLTQNPSARGMVIYLAVRAREAPHVVRGAVFMTLNSGAAIEALVGPMPGYLSACVVDPAAPANERRVAGLPGCDMPSARGGPLLTYHAELEVADRSLDLQLTAHESAVPSGANASSAWTLTVLGIAATSMLGALLLGTTGRARRFEAEAGQRQAALTHELDERARAESQARLDEQRLAALFETVPIGLRFTDLKGRLIDANPAFCQLTGYSLDELRRMDVFDLTHPADREEDRPMFEQVTRGHLERYQRQKRYITKSGEVRWVRVKVRLYPSPDGRQVHTVGVVEDITEHLALQEARQARETAEAANEAKNEFLSRMSHELRTPLNSMLGFAQLLSLQERERLSPRQHEWIGQIEQAGWHLLAMINDVLDLSRIEAGQMRLQIEPLDLAALLHATIALVEPEATRRGIELDTQIEPGATAALGDITRVKQILSNMLTNAIKYNREGGAVSLKARVGAQDRIEIDVTDTGLGMSPEQVADLFQPFNRLGRERSEIEGTGIGLVISQRLAHLMGGRLAVHSTEGVGTTVTLELPVAHGPGGTAAAAPPEAFAHSGYHHREVFYIEDNEVNAEVMKAIVARRPQIRLSVFGNGLDGLAAIQRGHPDLLLLDMNLPDIDGLAMLQHLQSDPELAGIPVVVVSADASEGQIGAGLQAGALRYLTKPLSVSEVLSTLDEVLGRQDTLFG